MKPKYLLLLFSILLTNLTVHACSCHHREDFTQKEFNDLGVIFTGQVVEDPTISQNLIKFKVIELFKGQDDNGFVYAQNEGRRSSCRISVRKNGHYLVFLYGKEVMPRINDCSRRIWIEDMTSFETPDWLTTSVNKPDGIDRSYYSNEKLASEGKFLNHQPEGFWKYYRKNGSLLSTGYYNQGLKDSIWTSCNYDGQIYSLTFYEQDEKKYEKTFQYYKNGNIKHTGYSEKGKRDYEHYWWENGELKQILTHSDKGEQMVVYAAKENGKVMVENGTGYYNMEGEPGYGIRREQGAYKDSLKVGTWRKEFKSTTLGETTYKDINDGNVEETTYKNGIKDGTFQRCNEDGQLIAEGAYQNGNRFGLWRFWYNSGQIRVEVKWLEGDVWRINSWDPDGHQMVMDGNGTEKNYDRDGIKLTEHTEEYINGKRKR